MVVEKTQEKKKALELLRQGHPRAAIAKTLNVHISTISNWAKKATTKESDEKNEFKRLKEKVVLLERQLNREKSSRENLEGIIKCRDKELEKIKAKHDALTGFYSRTVEEKVQDRQFFQGIIEILGNIAKQ